VKNKFAVILENMNIITKKIYQPLKRAIANLTGMIEHSFNINIRKKKENNNLFRTVTIKTDKPGDKPLISSNTSKHAKRINLKRFIPFAAGMIAIIVLALIIFLPPQRDKTEETSSLVAGVIENAAQSSDPDLSSDPENTESSDPEASKTTVKTNKKNKETSLKPETHSKKVIEIQERLMDLDFMEPDEPTDYYGPQTQYSLQLFQRKNNLQIDGIAGETTLKLLFSKSAHAYTVSLGERGTDVQELQERLKELGYLKGSVSGYFGTDTVTAVKSFQKLNGLSIDGNVGSSTREAIYSDDAREYSTAKKTTTKKTTTKKTTPKNEKSTKKIPNDKSVKSLIAFAKQQLGEPYVRGGKGPDKFDCSGFVYYCLKNIGVKLKYMTSAGWRSSSYPKVVKMSDLLPGDILCFKGHVGIYLGGGKMIDASSGQGKVRITGNMTKSKYWKRYFVCGRRVL
jgi:cell wall-associated NlpC family hydrolase